MYEIGRHVSRQSGRAFRRTIFDVMDYTLTREEMAEATALLRKHERGVLKPSFRWCAGALQPLMTIYTEVMPWKLLCALGLPVSSCHISEPAAHELIAHPAAARLEGMGDYANG